MAGMLNPDRAFLLEHVRFDKTIVSGQGMYIKDDKGNQYLDFLAQYGAVPFGHAPKEISEKVAQSLSASVPNMVQPFYTPASIELADKLIALSPYDHQYVTYTNSGAEAVEAAFKLAKAATGRRVIVSLNRGFHGKTSGALRATGNPIYSEPFMVGDEDHIKLDPGDFEQVEEVFREHDVAAFILETVLGEGGMLALSSQYIQHVNDCCKKNGAIFIVDEIQTGLGRLGAVYSITQIDSVSPDIICLAKALGGGVLPIGAVLSNKKAWSEEFGLYHSSTFANNQVCCTAGLAVLERLSDNEFDILDHVTRMSAYLESRLDELVSLYPDVYLQRTGKGLMQGLKVAPSKLEDSYFLAHAEYHGYFVPLVCGFLLNTKKVLVAPLYGRKDIIRVEPPLIVEMEHIDVLVDALKEAAKYIRHNQYSSFLSYLIDREPDELSYSEQNNYPLRRMNAVADDVPSDEAMLGRFAFLIHPTSDEDLINIMPESIVNLNEQHKSEFYKWMSSWFRRRYEPAPVFHARKIHSQLGGYVEGWLIACPLTPEKMMRLAKAKRNILLSQYIDVAKEKESEIVGLGAFTSIISRAGTDLLDQGVNITTGNSFTALASAESLHKALVKTGVASAETNIAIIGAAGSVGRLAAINLSEKYANIFLVGNPNNPRSLEKLDAVAGELYAHAIMLIQKGFHHGLSKVLKDNLENYGHVVRECNRVMLTGDEGDYARVKYLVEEHLKISPPIQQSIDLQYVLPKAQGVLSATSHGKSFIDPKLIAEYAVVCDAARPPDLSASVLDSRADVLLYEGGVVRFVEPYEFGRANILGFDKTLNLACLSETIALAMSGAKSSYSVGKNIPYDEAYQIYMTAIAHGFSDCIATSKGELDISGQFNASTNRGEVVCHTI